jgi:hypothetical protein
MADLAKGLRMDRSNLNKIVKKLGIEPEKARDSHNQWTHLFTSKQIKKILDYREGIPHDIVKTKKGYKLKDNS